MKKILVVLSVVAMMFVACTSNNGGNTPVPPTFPELQEFTVEAGSSYEITFTTDKAWALSLPAESQQYATMTYEGSTDMQFYGEAGEHTITVNVREGVMSYAKDIVLFVDMTLGTFTESIVKLTIPRTPYEITVTGAAPAGMDEIIQSTFEKGGHPENGPFASAANTYTVRYLNRSDALYGDFVVTHNCDLLYNYVVYAKSSADSEFKPVAENSNAWLVFSPWEPDETHKNFKLEMIHTDAAAVNTEGVGYEAYVNLEDENGDALVSVYFLYDPSAVAPVKPAIELAYPEEASAKGVTFVGEDTAYTLTLPTEDLLGENNKAASIKITGYAGGGYLTESLKLVESDVAGIYYTALAEGVTTDNLMRENTLSVSATNAEGAKEYTITVVFEWAPEAEDTPVETPEK